MFIVLYTYSTLQLGKSDEKGKVVKAEAALGRFSLRSSAVVPRLPWVLSTSERKIASERLKHICIPTHLDFNPTYLFSHPSRLKSHDWKQV